MNSYEHNIMRGEIYYVMNTTSTGSEKGRPAVIISATSMNAKCNTVQAVYLTMNPKLDLPTHITVRATGCASTAVCEQIFTVPKSRVGDYIATCSDGEMFSIETALMISLDIHCAETDEYSEDSAEDIDINEECASVNRTEEEQAHNDELVEAKAQFAILQKMYSDLLERVMQGRA